MADVTPDLRAAWQANPGMRVLSLNGYFDLSTPFFATEFDLAHLFLTPDLQSRLSVMLMPQAT
jgi:carboxypeptidase C (cathepsin A)